MICRFCGHENIAGTDECVQCLASLTHESAPSPSSAAERSLVADSISALRLPQPTCVPPEASVAEAIKRMVAAEVGYVLVTDEDRRLVGIFTERDVLYRIAGTVADLEAAPVRDFMTRNPTTVTASAPLAHVLHLQSVHGFRHIPVMDDTGRPAGVVSFRRIGRFIEEIA